MHKLKLERLMILLEFFTKKPCELDSTESPNSSKVQLKPSMLQVSIDHQKKEKRREKIHKILYNQDPNNRPPILYLTIITPCICTSFNSNIPRNKSKDFDRHFLSRSSCQNKAKLRLVLHRCSMYLRILRLAHQG